MTRPPWTADIAIDRTLATRLIAAQFLQYGEATVEPFGIGWDNAAFLAGGAVVFRFPRRRIAARLIDREIALLPGIAALVPLPISAPEFVGAPAPDYPWTFAGYPLIDGAVASSVPLTHEDRVAMAGPLAAFLRALHAIDPVPFVDRGLPPDEIARLDHARCV